VSDDALEQALRAMRHRERSGLEVDRHLEARGVEEPERREVLEVLVRTGVVDDRRYAELRASSLASRGAGDALIRHELSRAGIEAEIVEGAVARLTSELERAQLVVARRGASAKTARHLAGKGFADDVVHAVVAHSWDDALG
jgi:SOS response regulatory protein OraA/RecX